MARNPLEPWLPEEYGSDLIVRLLMASVAESVFRKIPMKSDTKGEPRMGAVGISVVPKGTAYAEDQSLNDEILLKTYKFGTAIRLAEEDIDDAGLIVDVIAAKKNDWSVAYARMIDNATIATTAAANGTTVPFTSIYRALATSNAATGYVANANLVASGVQFGSVTLTVATDVVTYQTNHGLLVGDKVRFGAITGATGITAGTTYFVKTVPSTTTVTLSATLNGATLDLTGVDGSAASATNKAGQASYDNLNLALSILEGSDFWSPTDTIVIAHPTLKLNLRGLKDLNGQPLFGDGNVATGEPDTIWGYPIKWSLGCRTSAVATSNPTGNPLVVFANPAYLFFGIRSGPESVVIDGRNGLSALTDETILKMRARRAFGVANENAVSILEIA